MTEDLPARLQFAVAAMTHGLFESTTIGLIAVIVILQTHPAISSCGITVPPDPVANCVPTRRRSYASIGPVHRRALMETATLLTLLGNLALIDNRQLAAEIGPVHGICYLLLLLFAALGSRLPRSARLVSIIPGIGGLLSLWLIRRHRLAVDAERLTRLTAVPDPDHDRDLTVRPTQETR